MMYIVRDAMETRSYDLFFNLSVLLGAFFVLKLMIAVQFKYLGDAFDEEDRRQREIQEAIKLKKLQNKDIEDDSFFEDEESEQESKNNTNEVNNSDESGRNSEKEK